VIAIRRPGRVDYEPTRRAMQHFTAQRADDTPDETWLLEHDPVFTLGLAGKPEHLLRDIGVPLVKIDRGAQITYHGPGQLIAYLLFDLRRRSYKVREMVTRMEQALIDLLADYGVSAERRRGAPGVYVADAKIAAIGLRAKNGCTYHGVSLNIDMDLSPYPAIDPCGCEGLSVCQLRDFAADCTISTVADRLRDHLQKNLQ
jgi:lipoyl(octanoyl) transferase